MKNSGCRQNCRELRRSKRGASEFSFEILTDEARDDAGPSGGVRAASGDLRLEGGNMLRLVEAHQQAENPLSALSRQARAVLGQF